jgi:tetratricopeptide (TPR) repeat protein
MRASERERRRGQAPALVTRNPQLTAKEIKLLALCHGRLGKVFLRLGKAARSIVEFDRQLSLAIEIGDTSEEADAFFGLGSGYLKCFDYENTIRYLNQAKSRFEAVGNIPRYCGALRTLSECYSRLNKQVQAAELRALYTELEDELRRKVSVINSKLDDLRER